MSALHLLRLRVCTPEFIRFAKDQSLVHVNDDGSGYLVHAWLAAMFGHHAPKPFRFDPRRAELLGYAREPAAVLAEHAQAFASPVAFAALQPESLVSKAMPTAWPSGRALRLDVDFCPISRTDDGEKDVYLRTLDRLGDASPTREITYQQWLRAQLEPAVSVASMEIVALSHRERLVRPDRAADKRRLRIVERPRVQCLVQAHVQEPVLFAELLARGVGRHRAFGFGMLLLSPSR